LEETSKLFRINLKFSSAFHPQTDGKTEIVYRSLVDLLKFWLEKSKGIGISNFSILV